MSALATKIAVGFFVLILVYYLLVYYKGGTAYIGAASSAINSGAQGFLASAKQGYAKG